MDDEINMDASIITAGTGCRAIIAKDWLEAIQNACNKFGITSNDAMACFLANVGVESGSLTSFVENLNYSAIGLANTWPSRFAVNPKAKPYAPNLAALQLAHKPQGIANNVYANRLGNGGVGSGDGWRFRGRGPIQITGHDNFARCGAAIGVDLIANPDALTLPDAGAASAAWFFADSGCTAAADAGDFARVVLLINGARPNDANGGPLREARRKAALAAITALA